VLIESSKSELTPADPWTLYLYAMSTIITGEAEKLFYKLVKDSINKVITIIITDCTFSKSSLSSSLPLLSPSDEQQSHVKSSPTAANHRMTI
jgi:hypothetical protein